MVSSPSAAAKSARWLAIAETLWAGHVPVERNPMELVTIRGATKRTRKPRSLTVEEFQKFIRHLEEPFRTLALVHRPVSSL
jgi:hypothetical protein